MRNVGVFPGLDIRCAESGCFPGRDEVRGRRVFPGRKYLLCIGLLLYKVGLSAILHEVLSTCMNVC